MNSSRRRAGRGLPLLRAALVTLLLGSFLGASGCSTERSANDLISPQSVGVLVVDATLIVGQALPPVFVRRTLSPEVPYDPVAAAVRGAAVKISVDPTATEPAFTWIYAEREPGSYVPGPGPTVGPDRTYHLRVEAADGRVVTASTHTPDPFHVKEWVRLDDNTLAVRDTLLTFDQVSPPDSLYRRNSFVYQEGLLEARFDLVDAAAYQVGITSLDEGSPFVIEADFLSQEDLDNLTREGVSPPFEASNGSVRLPWFAIFFEGRYRIRIFAIDRNWYDLVRTLPAFGGDGSGFGGNAGDRFEKPIFHIQGGIGLFGSASMDEIGFFVKPKPKPQPKGAPVP